MSREKFNHLNNKVDPENIEKTPIHLLNTSKLPETKTHFTSIKDKFSSDPDIVAAAENIITKIDNIIKLWNKRFSWEVMKAANDPYYWNDKKNSLTK